MSVDVEEIGPSGDASGGEPEKPEDAKEAAEDRAASGASRLKHVMTRVSRVAAKVGQVTGVVPRAVWLVFAVQTIYLIGLLLHGNPLEHPQRHMTVLGVIFAFFPAIAAVFFLESVVTKPRWLRFALLFLLFLVIATGNVILISSDAKADFGFLRENLHELRDREAFEMIWSVVEVPTRVTFFAELTGVIFFLYAPPDRPAWMEDATKRRQWMAALLVPTIFAFLGLVPSFDSAVLLGRSAYHYYLPILQMGRIRARDPRPYPYVHDFKPHPLSGVTRADNEHPNVVVVLMESFSGLYVHENAKDSYRYTPNMEEALSKGLAVEHFYGNSVQTCRGHFATLCGLVPSYRGKEHTFDPLDLECLPHVLTKHGYDTFFYTGATDPDFDDQIPFAKQMGFAVAECAPEKKKQPSAEKPFVWGWGYQDDHFYPWAFDRLAKSGGLSGEKPFFMVVAPVSNHYPFKDEPDFLTLKGEATLRRRRYMASLRNSDVRLAKLFEVMAEHGLAENTIVVLTGDHSFPADEHGYHYNERGAYEENFRVPFVVQWPGHITPRAISEEAHSQIDIAPTILDLLRVEATVPFVGKSLFDPSPEPPFVPLVQPYDGVILGGVEWPYKYVTHLASAESSFFDLSKDPHEDRELLPKNVPPDVKARLLGTVERIHFNQSLFFSNQFWPEHKELPDDDDDEDDDAGKRDGGREAGLKDTADAGNDPVEK